MKLLNVLSVTVFGVLFAVGCSSTDTTSTDGGADTGGTSETGGDTGGGTDSGGETASETGPDTCDPCVQTKCKSEYDTCQASADCKAVMTCIQMDIAMGGDGNSCISDETKPGVPDAIKVVTCASEQCAAECK